MGSGEILAATRVNSGTLLLIEFDGQMGLNSIYESSFTNTHSYLYSMKENTDAGLIYALVGAE